jgi:acetylornithine deacetylase
MSQKPDPQLLTDVMAIIDEKWGEEVAFLQQIGRFPSTLGNEADLQHWIAAFLKEELQMELDVFEPDLDMLSSMHGFSPVEWTYEGRPVVVGQWRCNGAKIGKSLILQGHIDVVSPEPTARWTYDPWDSTIVGERMYGRGLQDMKSGVAAMIYAVKAIREAGVELGADLLLETVIEEECTGNGALATLARGYRADGVLIPEPFGMTATTAQVGVVWIRVKVTGADAHVERADRAINAIEKACVLIRALEQYRDHINHHQPKHPRYEHHNTPLSVNVGTIQSGDWPSSVPLECSFVVRVGFYPGQDPQEIKEEVEAWILKAAREDEWLCQMPPAFSYYGFHAEGVELDPDQELFHVLESAHRTTQGTDLPQVSLTCTTDIRPYVMNAGIPATCYGATGGNMHGIDEYVELPSVKAITKTYAAFILEWCGVRKP